MAHRRRGVAPSSIAPPASSATKRPAVPAVTNMLLAALPGADRARILPLLETIPLVLREMLHGAGERVRYVYFPGGGFLSIVTVLDDGRMVEVATVGREGAVGLSAMSEGSPMPSACMVQGASDVCYRMTAVIFRHEMERRGAFYRLLTRYSDAYLGSIMISTACNAVHSIEQRLARWLLMAHDRMATDEFP